jgi:hypothetical protein
MVHSKSITCADVELRGEVTIGQGERSDDSPIEFCI